MDGVQLGFNFLNGSFPWGELAIPDKFFVRKADLQGKPLQPQFMARGTPQEPDGGKRFLRWHICTREVVTIWRKIGEIFSQKYGNVLVQGHANDI